MKHSPLDASHRALGAKMVEFGGWEMPLSYPAGTLSEHHACREGAAVFDVSHLGTVRVEGAGALERLQSAFTNDLTRIAPGRAQYTHLLDERDGSVLDDIIVWWVGEYRFDVMPNASNTDRVIAAIGGVDVTAQRAVIALQGPAARAVLRAIWPEAGHVGRFRVEEHPWNDAMCVVAGTGYTGGDGVEIAVPRDVASDLWSALIDAGAVPAGLGARDTLRLEAGLPLHGHELGPGISSLQAGLEWVVAWEKPHFRGKEALEAEKKRGVPRHLQGFAINGRRPAREGTVIVSQDGQRLGEVTSGNFAPTLGHCVAMGLVDARVSVGDIVQMDVRGSMIEATVVSMPFIGKD